MNGMNTPFEVVDRDMVSTINDNFSKKVNLDELPEKAYSTYKTIIKIERGILLLKSSFIVIGFSSKILLNYL